MQITVALKKQDGAFDAALIIDQKFTRSASGKSITDLFTKLAGALLVAQTADVEEVAINVGFLTGVEVERGEAQAKRHRETAEAEAEASELEKLVAARVREQAARDALTPMMAVPAVETPSAQ